MQVFGFDVNPELVHIIAIYIIKMHAYVMLSAPQRTTDTSISLSLRLINVV